MPPKRDIAMKSEEESVQQNSSQPPQNTNPKKTVPKNGEERRIACIECRQQKVKCIDQGEGRPCVRCTQRGFECVVDYFYKRTTKRKRLALLEEEMERLRAQLKSEPSQSPQPNQNMTNGAEVRAIQKQELFELPRVQFHASPRPITLAQPPPMVSSWDCEPKSAEGATLSSGMIRVLYNEFVTNYHPVLPVVDVSQGPAQIYKLSPALFWTIMAVASRRRPEDGLSEKMSGIQKACLAEIAVSPVTRFSASEANGSNNGATNGSDNASNFNLPSVYAVQAFLISTLWPLPTSSINADSSWNTSGIAVFTAIRAGLHCPGHQKDFERIFKSQHPNQAKLTEQIVTWLAANYVVQVVAGMFGYPSIANFNYKDAVRAAAPNTHALPARVRHAFAIEAVAHEIETSLNTSNGDAGRSSLIRILAARLDELESEYGPSLDARSWYTLLAERCHLYAYYLFDEFLPVSQRPSGIVAMYNSCLSLMDHAVRCTQYDEGFIKYMPLVDVQLLWQVASVVAKLWHSRYSVYLDKEAGSTLFHRTVNIVAQASLFEHDVPYRAAEIMPQMWNVFGVMATAKNEKVLAAVPNLRSRLAASLFFDCLWTMREGCEIRSHAPTQLTERTNRKSRHTANGVNGTSAPSIHESNPSSSSLSAQTPPSTASPAPMVPPFVTQPMVQTQLDSWELPGTTPWTSDSAWREVDSFMENFGFGLGELPYVSPPSEL